MAEAILRRAAEGLVEVASAGSRPAARVHPTAVAVMREIGFDLSGARPRHVDDFLGSGVSTVITVCADADQACPAFPGKVRRHHWGFEDPAKVTGSEEEVLAQFRRIRDQIRAVFEAYAAGLGDANPVA
jgi:arsenate reductase (thioredoxin)